MRDPIEPYSEALPICINIFKSFKTYLIEIFTPNDVRVVSFYFIVMINISPQLIKNSNFILFKNSLFVLIYLHINTLYFYFLKLKGLFFDKL